MIQLFHVYKSYGDNQALTDVSISIEQGDFSFLTGPSGAGKSTLLKLIFRSEVANRGQILVNGYNLSRLKQKEVPLLRRNIGVVFQDFKLLHRRTVEQNVAITLEVLGMPKEEIREKCHAMLKKMALSHKLHQYPQQLSGGEQQRIAIARALVNEPKILIADEPTGNLDAERAHETMVLLEEANSWGTTVLLATHDRNLLDRYNKRRIHIEDGRVTKN